MHGNSEPIGKSPFGGWVAVAVTLLLGWLIWGNGLDTLSNDENTRVIVVTPRPTSIPSNNPDEWCGGKPSGPVSEGYVDCMDEHFRPTEDAQRAEWERKNSEEGHIERAIEEGEEAGKEPARWDNPQWADCEDFYFQREAQAFFVAAGGPEEDAFLLDDDEDGRACELLPLSLE